MFNVTDAASSKIKSLLIDKSDNTNIRIRVVGGGCSGLSYKLDFDTNFDQKMDKIIYKSEFLIITDNKSNLFLDSCQLDFNDGLNNTGFIFVNSLAKRTCGCGLSFTV